jgi:hypothetical protein
VSGSDGIYRVIQSCSTNFKKILGRSFGAENVNKVHFRFATVSDFRLFLCVDVAFITVDFYKMETIRYNITFQLISLFAMKEILPFLASFNRHFRALLLVYFSVHVVGTCQRTVYAVHNCFDNSASAIYISTNSQRGAKATST